MTLFSTIVVDPPWRYRTAGITSTSNRPATKPSASAQYATMTPAEIAALPFGEQAAADAHLYLWITNPMLFEASPILAAWGFEYVTLLTWHKLGTFGLGYYFRGDTEHVVFAVRGKLPIEPALRVSNHFAAKKVGHSVKPDRFYEIVERVSPEPRLELFARRRRVGWAVWGDQAPGEEAARTQQHFALVP
jgi:N6-adenosine-specific RNA methylase IME4